MKLVQIRKKKLTTGQQLLLAYLFKSEGSVRATAKLIGVPEYQLHVWRGRGGVPLSNIKLVSSKLGVPIPALNYEEGISSGLFSERPWIECVKACRLPPEIEKKILAAKAPK